MAARSSTVVQPAGAPRRSVVGIKVKFEVISKNRLRRIVFSLAKDTDDDTVTWEINFELYEREKKSEEWGEPLVDLDVEVESRLNARAEKVAEKGLTTGQAAHLLGPAASDAKAGDKEVAKETIQETLAKK